MNFIICDQSLSPAEASEAIKRGKDLDFPHYSANPLYSAERMILILNPLGIVENDQILKGNQECVRNVC
jgi:hypothetical protein